MKTNYHTWYTCRRYFKGNFICSQQWWFFIVDFSISWSLFWPNSIMFQTKAKDTSFSGCISTVTFSTRPICSLDQKLFPSKECGIGIWPVLSRLRIRLTKNKCNKSLNWIEFCKRDSNLGIGISEGWSIIDFASLPLEVAQPTVCTKWQ